MEGANFVDGAEGKARDAVHILFANEKVKPDESVVNPDVSESGKGTSYNVLPLPALVQIKLTACRDKDRTPLRDLIDVGLVDLSWPTHFPAPRSVVKPAKTKANFIISLLRELR